MNFKDLLEKLSSMEEAGQGIMAPPSEPGLPECDATPAEPSKMPNDGEFLTGECSDMMPGQAPKQSDSVTMNVSMNGSGAGGIKDLLDILRNIEHAGEHKDADDVLVGVEAEETFDNEPNPKTAGIGAVTPTGDDLFSKGKEASKVNGGGNPMQEALIAKLSEKYESIKSR